MGSAGEIASALDARTFRELCELVYEKAGIHLGENKRVLVVARLNKRLAQLGLDSFEAYLALLRSPRGAAGELQEMVNCITTNKTEFFRDGWQFDYLRSTVAAEAKERARRGAPRRIRVWSAGCSTGEEPYSIAMTLAQELPAWDGWDVRILATDIDTQVLARASAAVYAADRTGGIPDHLARRSLTPCVEGFRISDEIRSLVTFRRINFVDDVWPIHARFDAVFCKNVTIYFDRATQDRLYRRLVRYMEPHGTFFAGSSENLAWLPELFTSLGNAIYAPADGDARSPSPLRTRGVRAFELTPATFRASTTPLLVRSTLGPHAAVCIWDSASGIGGVGIVGVGPERATLEGARTILDGLVRDLVRLGANPMHMQAKALGCAAATNGAGENTHADTTATSTVDPLATAGFVRSYLESRGFDLVSHRLGGSGEVDFAFETHTGRAFVRPKAPGLAALASLDFTPTGTSSEITEHANERCA